MERHSGPPPVGVAVFVGRERERATLAALVAHTRVVTLTGSGGCGKTRLAVEFVGDVAARYADGARWVDLQGIRDPATVAAAVGAALGVHAQPGRSMHETLAEHLQERRQLVVLDNCEHLVEACARLVSTLTPRCAHLHVLATSRVPLAIDGEATYEVAPLPVPDPGAASLSTVAAVDAARLFEVRARQVATGFRIDADNAPAVAEICRRLDGIPLAIELAAARTRVLSPGQIAAGLSDRFALLTGGTRGAPARQRTLEASLDWSHDLLDGAQRLALARLSVFAGSFEMDAAEAVLVGDGIDAGDVLDLVAALVEQSLVQVVHRQGGTRYRLLETVRVYGRQRLSALPDSDLVRDRHLAFHIALAGRARASLHGTAPEPWTERLTADLDDLRLAMDHAVGSDDLRGLLDLTEPLVRFWFDRGVSGEVLRRLREGVGGSTASHDERARGLVTAATLAIACAEPTTAHDLADEAVAAAHAAGGGQRLALALGQRALSSALSGLSTGEQVDSDVAQALELAQRDADASVHAFVLAFAGGALLHSRSLTAGTRLFEQAVELCASSGLALQLPAAHGGHVMWSPWSGNLEETRHHSRRAVELSRRVDRPGWEATGLVGLAAAAVLAGDHTEAHDRLSEAEALLHARGLSGSHHAMWLRPWQAIAAYARGDLEAAAAGAAEVHRTGRALGNRWDESLGGWLLGLAAHARGDDVTARTHLEACRALSTSTRLPFGMGRSLLGLAGLAEQDGDLLTAWELAHDALGVLDEYGDRVGTATALDVIAGLANGLGDPERSLRLLGASDRFHTESGLARFLSAATCFDRARSAARLAMQPADASACWDAGRGLSLAEAVTYARRGRGDRRRPASGWDSLTPVESDVVRLVAEGHANAEIGRRLFISVNTVKKHLSHVYAKIEVEGRADLAAQVARRDL